MKKKRGAIETGTLVLYIILVASTLTLAGVVTIYANLVSKDARKRACEFDINKASLSKLLPDEDNLFTRGHQQTSLSNCRRDKLGNLEIRYKDVVENGEINQKKAHKIIADEMVDCWKMAGAGTRDPFSNWDDGGESYCMICSTIKFDKKMIELYNKGFEVRDGKNVMTRENFDKYRIGPVTEYLKNEEMEDGKKIWEFLYNDEAIDYKEEIHVGENKPNIDKGNEFLSVVPETTIMIQMYKMEGKGKLVRNMIIGGAAIVTGLVLTSTGFGAVVGVPLIVAAGGVIGVAAGVGGIYMVVHSGSEAYRECKNCNGIGGIQLVPAQKAFDIEMDVQMDGKDMKIPICSRIVN